MALGKKIEKIRSEKGLSQDDLSKLTGWTPENPAVGVSQGAISAMECRDSRSSGHAPALALALDVDLAWLLGGEADNTESQKKYPKGISAKGGCAKVTDALHNARRANLKKIIDERFNGNMASLSRFTNRSAGIYSQVLADIPIKGFGERLARSIERELDLPLGALDQNEIELEKLPFSQEDELFFLSVKNIIAKKSIPSHLKQTVLFLLDASPERAEETT